MNPTLIVATVLITLALVSYSVGVWAERLERYLRPWHLAAFWIGLLFDASGTYAMERLSGSWNWVSSHALTGLAAIVLMFGHAVWATIVIVRRDERIRARFHSLSVAVWALWLVPYIGGLIVGMFGQGRP